MRLSIWKQQKFKIYSMESPIPLKDRSTVSTMSHPLYPCSFRCKINIILCLQSDSSKILLLIISREILTGRALNLKEAREREAISGLDSSISNISFKDLSINTDHSISMILGFSAVPSLSHHLELTRQMIRWVWRWLGHANAILMELILIPSFLVILLSFRFQRIDHLFDRFRSI